MQYKLNNKGWGMSVFIAFIVIFIIFLIISSVISYRMDLNHGNNLYVYINISVTSYDYTSLEIKLKNAAVSYVKQKDLKINTGETITVTYEELFNMHIINNLKDNVGTCEGYVKLIYNGTSITYSPYIKCVGRYQTNGY